MGIFTHDTPSYNISHFCIKKKKKKKKSITGSNTHPRTDQTRRCLTCSVKRDALPTELIAKTVCKTFNRTTSVLGEVSKAEFRIFVHVLLLKVL